MIIVLLVLLLFALGYVVITKKKRTQSNVSSKFNTPAVDTKVNAPVNESCTENKIVEFPDNATTQTETADITKESAPFVTQPSSVITSGENEYYKELLWDNRWIQKRDNRKRIDHYVCQNCYNTIKLDNIGEVSKYVDSSELADIVISAFNEENSLQQNDDETLGKQSLGGYKSYKVKEMTKYIPKYNIYLNNYHLGLFSCSQYWKTIALAGHINIISSKNLSDNDVNWVDFKSIKCKPFKTKIKNGYKDCNTIFIQYMKGNTTNDAIYLTYCFGYITGVDYNQGVAMLTKNDFAIIFPLYKLNSPETLEVHHKKYSRSHLPWDVKDEDLITLCHSCHIEANKKAIPVE